MEAVGTRVAAGPDLSAAPAATAAPAPLAGAASMGRLVAAADADLVILDERFEAAATVVEGTRVGDGKTGRLPAGVPGQPAAAAACRSGGGGVG